MEQQHYVPKFLLKRFASGKGRALWAFDKSTGRSFKTHVKNVAAEHGFYDLLDEDKLLSLEPSLSQLETKTAAIVQGLLSNPTLSELTDASRDVLASFMAVQFVRTKEHRLRFEHLSDSIRQKLKEGGTPDEQIRRLTYDEGLTDPAKVHGLSSILEAGAYIPYFAEKDWILFQSPSATPFYISDNPIALHNLNDFGPYGNLGLAVPGIHIYLPLSPSISLGVFCKSITTSIRQLGSRIQRIDMERPGFADAALPGAVHTRAMFKALTNGSVVPTSREMAEHMNSLQVTFSSRYVFSQTDDFTVVRTMLASNPNYAHGLKSRMD